MTFNRESLVKKITDTLIMRGETVASAESCTGGKIASRIVDIPGTSACFNEGYVTYSNEAKHKNLGVSNEILAAYGAVSRETAVAMAEGVRRRANATYGVATTGIAGPTGGSAEKPVGTVYICVSNGKEAVTRRYCFKGNRTQVRDQAADKAFELLLEMEESQCV